MKMLFILLQLFSSTLHHLLADDANQLHLNPGVYIYQVCISSPPLFSRLIFFPTDYFWNKTLFVWCREKEEVISNLSRISNHFRYPSCILPDILQMKKCLIIEDAYLSDLFAVWKIKNIYNILYNNRILPLREAAKKVHFSVARLLRPFAPPPLASA